METDKANKENEVKELYSKTDWPTENEIQTLKKNLKLMVELLTEINTIQHKKKEWMKSLTFSDIHNHWDLNKECYWYVGRNLGY